jgi:hypothetical protein
VIEYCHKIELAWDIIEKSLGAVGRRICDDANGLAFAAKWGRR